MKLGWVCVLILVPPLFVLPAHAEEKMWREHNIAADSLSADERALLEETVRRIGSLPQGEVTMNPSAYYRLSRFKRLFGFRFDGERLKGWLLARMKSVVYGEGWTIAENDHQGNFRLGDRFFKKSDFLERAYCLIHEARHTDGDGFRHVPCPKDHRYVSAGAPGMDLTQNLACDAMEDGAYAFQAAFLFELYARGFEGGERAGLLYNSSLTRIVVSPRADDSAISHR